MALRNQPDLVSEAKTKLFEDDVVMRPSGTSADPKPFTLAILEIERVYDSGRETSGLYLSGIKGHGAHQSAVKFVWDMSEVRFSVVQEMLKIQIARMRPRKSPETWTVLLKTKEQLASWVAEIMQYRDWKPMNYKDEFYHVLWPRDLAYVNAVLLPSGGRLLIANPLFTDTDVYMSWKAKNIQRFEVNVSSQQPQLFIYDAARGRQMVQLLNHKAAKRISHLLWSLVSDQSPGSTVKKVEIGSSITYEINRKAPVRRYVSNPSSSSFHTPPPPHSADDVDVSSSSDGTPVAAAMATSTRKFVRPASIPSQLYDDVAEIDYEDVAPDYENVASASKSQSVEVEHDYENVQQQQQSHAYANVPVYANAKMLRSRRSSTYL